MLGMALFYSCLVSVVTAGLLSARSDFSRLQIPNIYPVVIAAAFLGAAIVFHFYRLPGAEPLYGHFLAGVGTLLVTFLLFFFKIMGGGDAKLLSAFALWTGAGGLVAMILVMALTGGALGLAAKIIGRRKPFKDPDEKGWIGHLQRGENRVPYGIAITAGAFYAFFYKGYFGPEFLTAFLA